MRITLLNTYDWGGAGTATKRIHRGLRQIGVDSRMIVANKRGDDSYVYDPESTFRRIYSLARIVLDPLPLKLFGGADGGYSVGWLPDDLHTRVGRHDPDLLHLNWVGEGFLNVRTLRKLDLPIVWRLPDMWAFTGGCHYADGCDRFTDTCGSCPRLNSSMERDVSRWTLRRKRKFLSNMNITVVAPSSWLADQASKSTLFADNRIEIIPNGLDTTIYRSYDSEFARNVFNLPKNKKIILFGSVSPTSDPRKGFEYLQNGLTSLADVESTDEIQIVVFGSSEPEEPPNLGFDTRYVGYLNDDESLALLYSAADVMVVPSKYEGFGQTVTESLSCGTPVVAFDTTGPSDTISHKQTGYLATPYDADDLATGIQWVIGNTNRHERLASAARERAVNKYDIDIIAKRYRDLYRDIL